MMMLERLIRRFPKAAGTPIARTPEATFSFTEKSLRLMLREDEPFRK